MPQVPSLDPLQRSGASWVFHLLRFVEHIWTVFCYASRYGSHFPEYQACQVGSSQTQISAAIKLDLAARPCSGGLSREQPQVRSSVPRSSDTDSLRHPVQRSWATKWFLEEAGSVGGSQPL